MRIWHPSLLPILPQRKLCALHRDVCALRGKSWGCKGQSLQYLWVQGYTTLHTYHVKVMVEMKRRGWKPNSDWMSPFWRGSQLPKVAPEWMTYGPSEFPEHNPILLANQAMALLASYRTQPNTWLDGEFQKAIAWLVSQGLPDR